MNIVQAKPVFSVPVSTGIASRVAAANENGVSLFHGTTAPTNQQPPDSILASRRLTYHVNQPYRGAGRTVLFGVSGLKVFTRQHIGVVQFASAPVA